MKSISDKLTGEFWLLVVVCALQGAALLLWGFRNDFLTYRQDMGETHVAFRQSENLQHTFPHYGMLHVETSESGKTRVYTHNVNLGTYYFFFWRCLGVDSRQALTVLILPVHLAGLAIGYLAIRHATESRIAAGVFLALMTLDFANVGAFAFNALRAWHYVGLFGVLYGTREIVAASADSHPVLARFVTAGAAAVSFGCGYDFFVIVAACAVVQLLLTTEWRRIPAAMVWLAACFLVPFVARQLEVIYWIGSAKWLTDFYLTFAIKVPFASRVLPIPSIGEVDAIYEQAGLLRPPAYPTSDLGGIWRTAHPLFRLAVFPNYGLLGCLAVAFCVLAALASALLARNGATFRRTHLVAAYGIGAASGMLVFAPFSLHVYLKHNFPLVAGLVHLAEAVCFALAYQAARRLLAERARFPSALLFATCVLLAANAVAVQLANARSSNELDLRWMQRLDQLVRTGVLRSESLVAAVKMPPEADDLLTRTAQGRTVPPHLAPWILARASRLLVERPLIDPPDPTPLTTLVYAPGDGWCNLDAREPDLQRRDWLQFLWLKLTSPTPASVLARLAPSAVVKPENKVHPDDIVHIDFAVGVPPDPPVPRAVPELEVQVADGRSFSFRNIVDDIPFRRPTGAVSLVYNAKFSVLHAYARMPRDLMTPQLDVTSLTVRGILHFGATTVRSEPLVVKFSPTALRSDVKPLLPEPTTAALCDAFPNLGAIERSRTGVGYAILDLTSMQR